MVLDTQCLLARGTYDAKYRSKLCILLANSKRFAILLIKEQVLIRIWVVPQTQVLSTESAGHLVDLGIETPQSVVVARFFAFRNLFLIASY